jgi:hypothetical protein
VAAPGGTMDTGGAGSVAIATDFSILYAPRMPHPSLFAISSVCASRSRTSLTHLSTTAPSPAPRPLAARTAT